jgi:hypothetical protein
MYTGSVAAVEPMSRSRLRARLRVALTSVDRTRFRKAGRAAVSPLPAWRTCERSYGAPVHQGQTYIFRCTIIVLRGEPASAPTALRSTRGHALSCLPVSTFFAFSSPALACLPGQGNLLRRRASAALTAQAVAAPWRCEGGSGGQDSRRGVFAQRTRARR